MTAALNEFKRDMEADVAELAERAALAPPRLRLEPISGLSIIGGRRPLLRVDPGLRRAPRPQRLALLAHELGHLALGHHAPRRASVATVAVFAPFLPLVYVGATGKEVTSALVLSNIAVAGAVFLVVMRWLSRYTQPEEFAADRFAVDLLGEATSTVTAIDWIRTRGHLRAWTVSWRRGSAHIPRMPSGASQRSQLAAGSSRPPARNEPVLPPPLASTPARQWGLPPMRANTPVRAPSHPNRGGHSGPGAVSCCKVPRSSSHLRPIGPSSVARVCRAYGCADPARELGFCAGCVEDYQRRRAGDELRLARLATRLAAAPGSARPIHGAGP